jgi:hypothetical protein
LRRGITLPVNSVIIIALAIFVLLMLAMFLGRSSGQLGYAELATSYREGCSQLKSSYQCSTEGVTQVTTSFTEEGEAKDLLYVCRKYHNNPIMTVQQCRWSCSGCEKRVYAGTECTVGSDDCDTPYTLGWGCSEVEPGRGECVPYVVR